MFGGLTKKVGGLRLSFHAPGQHWAFAVSPSFPQQQNFAMGSLAQISSGAIRCSLNTRFWARFRRVPEGSGGFRRVPEGSGGFRRVPEQIPGEVSEGSGPDTC